MRSPLTLEPLFHWGPVPITSPVVTTWGIMAITLCACALCTRGLSMKPGRLQTALETLVAAIDQQIRETLQLDPAPYRTFIGALFVFILLANWASLVPGVEPPTAHIETDAALALLVFIASIVNGISMRGIGGYLGTFAAPSWFMLPLNVLEQLTRTFSLIVRLFGNIMSGVFVIGIVLSLAGLLVPIPLMALDLLTGAVQAYIFAILATVFIGAAVGDEHAATASTSNRRIS
jgi:F-type H+-transporting ATPase subunit a